MFIAEFGLMSYTFIFQTTLLDFSWRNAFKDLSSSVAHCITIAIEDFSTKILQLEQKEESSAAVYTMSLVNIQQMRESWETVHEEEQPKRIAKAGIQRSEVCRETECQGCLLSKL